MITNSKSVFQAKWLGIQQITHQQQTSEYIYRPFSNKQQLLIQGVEIIPIIKYSNKSPDLLLIAVYRPPVGKYVLQFPSGVVDSPNYEECAYLQLLQETGYRAETIAVVTSPLLMIDTKKSNENEMMVVATINGDIHGPPKQQLDKEQSIVVHKIELNGKVCDQLLRLQAAYKYQIEAKIWHVGVGLALTNLL